MARAEDIRDEGSLRAWLEGRPTVAMRLAHRAAASVLPVIETLLRSYRGSHDFEAQSARAVLAGIRLNLILQVLAFRTHEIPVDRLISRVDFAEQEWLSIEDIFDATVVPPLHAPLYALVSAILASRPEAHFAHEDPTTLLRARTSFDALRTSLRASTMLKDSSQRLAAKNGSDEFPVLAADIEAALSDQPAAIVLPEHIGQSWLVARSEWQKRGERWSFWINWYEHLLAGREQDWVFLTRIALIPDEVWQQGPGAVAERIALIEEQMRLLREAERLKAELAAARDEVAALSRRSHNNPPELVEPVAEIEQRAGEIAGVLEVAARELRSDAPRATVLRRVGAALLVAAGKSLAYCASLGDVALKKAAEETGSLGAKALIGAGLLAWMSQLEAVKTLGRALEAFAKLLGG